MRQRTTVTTAEGKVLVISHTKNFWGQSFTGVLVCSESPKHAAKSIRKVAAYRHRLLNAPQSVKLNYTEEQRKKLRRIFRNMDDYKKAIGF